MPPITFEGGCDHKVIGGKLLRARVSIISGEKGPELVNVRLFGDFFMHPEEAIEDLEALVLDAGLDESRRKVLVEGFLSREEVTLMGATSTDILFAIGSSVENAMNKICLE